MASEVSAKSIKSCRAVPNPPILLMKFLARRYIQSCPAAGDESHVSKRLRSDAVAVVAFRVRGLRTARRRRSDVRRHRGGDGVPIPASAELCTINDSDMKLCRVVPNDTAVLEN